MGVQPQRIDILTGDGCRFRDRLDGENRHRVDALDLPFIGREALLRNKRATGRTKELANMEILERQKDRLPH